MTPVVRIGRGRKPAAESDRRAHCTPPPSPALPRLSTRCQPRQVGRGEAGNPSLRFWSAGGLRGSWGDLEAAGSALHWGLGLSPSRGKSNRVAPPVGLGIVGRRSFPPPIVAGRRRCAERPTPLRFRAR